MNCNHEAPIVAQVAPPLTRNPYGDHESREDLLVTHALRGEGFDASGGGQVAVAYRTAGDGCVYEEGDTTAPLTTATDPSANVVAIQNATRGKEQNGLGISTDGSMYTLDQGSQHGVFAMNLRGRDGGAMPELDELAILRAASGGSSRSYVGGNMAVRRLTPRECERLMAYEDDYTLVPYRGKMMADGPRYKMLGNSIITHQMRWIGERIQMVDNLSNPKGEVIHGGTN